MSRKTEPIAAHAMGKNLIGAVLPCSESCLETGSCIPDNRNPWLAAFPLVAPEGTRLHFCLRQKLRLRRPLRRRARRPRRLATDISSPFLFCAKEKGAHSVRPLFFGTPEGTRTPNPQNRNLMLYPLSHRRVCLSIIAKAGAKVKHFLPFWGK